MWEPLSSNYPPETLPWGVLQPPPRLPPAPPATSEAPRPGREPDRGTRTLDLLLRECLEPASAVYGFLSIHDHAARAALQQAAQGTPFPTWEKILADLAGMIRSERRMLHRHLTETQRLYLQGPRRFVDADQAVTGVRLHHLMRQGVPNEALLEVLSVPMELEPPPDEGSADEPPMRYQVPLPQGLPQWADAQLPAHALVRWLLDDLVEAAAAKHNYASLGLFTVRIAYPLAALSLALRAELDLTYAP